MKVALIGNMNNNSNNLAHYLLDAGIDVEVLFFANEASHFGPDADNVLPVRYVSKQLSWGGYRSYFTTSAARIRSDLEPYDFLIGSRLAPAYCRKAGRHLDIFMPTGGDLHTVPVWNGWKPRDVVKYFGFARIQREAIKQVGALYWDVTNDEIEKTIAPFTSHIPRMSHAIPMIYHPEYQGEALEVRQQKSEWRERFRDAREGADIFLFSHVKHVWTPKAIAHYGRFHEKGNDHVIRALASYYRGNPTKSIRLALFEFGDDHLATRALARELDVDKYIAWFPQMPRREIMLGLAESDGLIGEISRSWFSYGTILEAMVMRRAIIHHRDDTLYSGIELYSMVDARSDKDLEDIFVAIAKDEIDLELLGKSSYDWLVQVSMKNAINEIVARIEGKNHE